MSPEISTHKCVLPTLTRDVQLLVRIIQPHFPHECVKIKLRFFFPSDFLSLFPFLPYFILAHVQGLNGSTKFNALWLKCVDWRKEVFCMFELFQTTIRGWYISPKNYPQKSRMLKFQQNEQSRITSKQQKIDKKCQWHMNIKSGSPFHNPQI